MTVMKPVNVFGFGPWQDTFQNPYLMSNPGAQGVERMVKGFARCQLAAWGLASRRGQAAMALPGRLGQCRTPQDIARLQGEFMRTMFEQYAETTRAMVEAIAEASSTPAAVGAPAAEQRKLELVAVQPTPYSVPIPYINASREPPRRREAANGSAGSARVHA
ncbi:MAG: phasin family protein [Hyphomicrobiaceae bacterium]|nr:phasin family protein [Hyphomicrobiaceae bacterium]